MLGLPTSCVQLDKAAYASAWANICNGQLCLELLSLHSEHCCSLPLLSALHCVHGCMKTIACGACDPEDKQSEGLTAGFAFCVL